MEDQKKGKKVLKDLEVQVKSQISSEKADEMLETLYTSRGEFGLEDDIPEKTMRKLLRRRKNQPIHYRTVCISLYNRDIALLEQMLRKLRRLGHTKINKSQIIRFALSQVDVVNMPRAL
ncbi:MAG: hypothetical protein HYW47_02615 [Deltaproteobacteria bacterium]|nr:hypothetical protein [Deltaproteobacteria bacterium]